MSEGSDSDSENESDTEVEPNTDTAEMSKLATILETIAEEQWSIDVIISN